MTIQIYKPKPIFKCVVLFVDLCARSDLPFSIKYGHKAHKESQWTRRLL
jgi:hypothetical protein